jgi:precorrin-6A/cobalt-precorrin-6A reductase
MKILLLGGTGEGRRLAVELHRLGHEVIYSLAGVAGIVDLPCRVRVGGFGGVGGLVEYLRGEGVERLLDATHPYAARIHHHAAAAAEAVGLPLWALRRPPWRPRPGDDWRPAGDWAAVREALHGFRRPLFTIGRGPLGEAGTIPAGQHWIVRCLPGGEAPVHPRFTLVAARPHADPEEEIGLMRKHGVDVLVSKNSGGTAAYGKIEAARRLRLPVIMLERPVLPVARREFEEVGALLAAMEVS